MFLLCGTIGKGGEIRGKCGWGFIENRSSGDISKEELGEWGTQGVERVSAGGPKYQHSFQQTKPNQTKEMPIHEPVREKSGVFLNSSWFSRRSTPSSEKHSSVASRLANGPSFLVWCVGTTPENIKIRASKFPRRQANAKFDPGTHESAQKNVQGSVHGNVPHTIHEKLHSLC